jgi:hypothetical protein
MGRESTPTAPGGAMGTTLSIAELLRIEALLSRLEADPGGTCQVAGCLHAHDGPTGVEDLPAAA